MAVTQDFAFGWLTPALAWVLALTGCLVGLIALGHSPTAGSRGERHRWLGIAAFAIGGTAIWTMHFMAMIGYTVEGAQIGYDVSITTASWFTSTIFVGFGMFVAGYGRPTAPRLIIAAILTGAGEDGMHFFGMNAMRMDGVPMFDSRRIAGALAIGVIASAIAYWLTLRRGTLPVVTVAALVMATALTATHYLVVSAMRVHLDARLSARAGVPAIELIFPIVGVLVLAASALFYSLLAPTPGVEAATRAAYYKYLTQPRHRQIEYPSETGQREGFLASVGSQPVEQFPEYDISDVRLPNTINQAHSPSPSHRAAAADQPGPRRSAV